MGKSDDKYSLTVSAVFKQLKIRKDRKSKKEPVKEIFPELYTIWRKGWKPNAKEEIAESTLSRIKNAYSGCEDYYDLSASYFGLLLIDQKTRDIFEEEIKSKKLPSGSVPDGDKFSAVFKSIQSGLEKWDKNKMLATQEVQKLYEMFCNDLDAFQSPDSNTKIGLSKLTKYFRAHQRVDDSSKLDVLTCYLVLALTQMHWEDSVQALVEYCEKNGLLDKKVEVTFSERLSEKREEWRRAKGKEKEVIRKEYLALLESGCEEGDAEAYIERAERLWEQSPLLGGRERDIWASREEKFGLEDCKVILEHPEGKRKIVLGTAYWLLHQMMESDKTKAKATKLAASLGINSSVDALLRACACDKKEALERANSSAWKKKIGTKNRRKAVSLIHVLEKGTLEEGCKNYINCDEKTDWANVITRTIEMQPLPENTIPEIDRDRTNAGLQVKVGLECSIPPIRFFLLDPDEAKNLKDTLRIMQAIKDNKDADPKRYEIFLRGCEEIVAPLVDTAQEHMDGRYIKVHILDPDKRMAQRLLTYHPLFYPLRDLNELHSSSDSQIHRLHFVILGDDACCEWLLRESFWLTTFRERANVKVCATITMIAPGAKQRLERIVQKCPGMKDMLVSGLSKDAQAPILVDAINQDLESEAVDEWIRKRYSAEHTSCYFAVASGSDLENLQLAIHLREVLTRERIRMGMPTRMEDVPVIAYRCKDSDIANLSRETVVINENLGTAWYNHYKLIPFGVLSDLYTWEALTDDPLEKISYCTHLQYSNVPVDLQDAFEENVKDAENNYLRRSYNRDSSMAVAVSLPYRLFQSRFLEKVSGNGEKYYCGIMPPAWDILDDEAFFEESFLNQAAALYKYKVESKGTEEDENANVIPNSISREFMEIEKWEHERWNRFMISRGWIPCGTVQVKKYQEAGNTRKQLYIGKMHPFIVPYGNLEALERSLGGQILAIDSDNIAATGSIIQMEWLDEKTREQDFDR